MMSKGTLNKPIRNVKNVKNIQVFIKEYKSIFDEGFARVVTVLEFTNYTILNVKYRNFENTNF